MSIDKSITTLVERVFKLFFEHFMKLLILALGAGIMDPVDSQKCFIIVYFLN
jgi:hypothetical protein